MNELTAERLVAINQTFYRRFAAAFDETRTGAWPGWHRLLQTERPRRVLDLGCGNGRFARFLSKRPAADRIAYEGWDDNPDLLARAQARAAPSEPSPSSGFEHGTTFRCVDLLAPTWPQAAADLVVVFGVMHHIPTFDQRRALLRRALERVSNKGRLAVCFWQFAPAGVPRVAVAPWAEADIDPHDVDPGDFLVRWRRGGQGLRYCHHCAPEEVDALITELGAREIDRFTSDGAAGDLNLYTVLQP